MKFIPTLNAAGNLILPNGSTIEFDATSFTKIILAGDQLTIARIRGTQLLPKLKTRLLTGLMASSLSLKISMCNSQM